MWSCGDSGGAGPGGGADDAGSKDAALAGGADGAAGAGGQSPGHGGSGGADTSRPGGTASDATGGAPGDAAADASGGFPGDAGGGRSSDASTDATHPDAAAPDEGVGPTPCVSDDTCPAGTYCGEAGLCVAGCRDADSACPADAAGRPQSCDAVTHTCLPLVVCCRAVGACALTRDDACAGTPLMGSTTCDQDPCGPECLSDDDCDAVRFCHPVDFRCTRGCRVGDSEACPYDETCRPEDRTCGVLDCADHDDCRDPRQYCDFVGALATRTCREGCRDDAACGGEGRCAADRTCVFLCEAENDQCPAGHVCDAPSGRCVPLCEGDADCPPDEICDALTARCAPGCREDAGEPDDVQAEARRVELSPADADGLRHGQAVGRMCSLNPDVFSVEIPEGGRLRATLDFEVDGQSFIAIAVPDEPSMGELAFQTSPATVTFPALGEVRPGGPVYLTVTSESELGSDYTLSVDVADGERACFPDPGEPGDDTAAGAHRLGRDTGTLSGALCPGDADWLVLRLGRNDGFALSLRVAAGGDPLLAEMYRASRVDALPAAEPDLVTGEGFPGPEGTAYEIVVPADTAAFSDEDWYIRVRGSAPGAQGEYRLSYDRVPSEVICDNDERTEPNDDPGNAVDLDLMRGISEGGRLVPGIEHVVPLDLALCPGDVDTFCLIADRDDSIRAAVASEGGAGLRFLDAFGDPQSPLLPGTRPGEPAAFHRTGRIAGGRSCVQVTGGGGPYILTVARDAPAMFVCAADAAETDPVSGRRDDLPDTARAVPPPGADPQRFSVDDGYLCDPAAASDEDWYRFEPAPRLGRLCVTVTGFAASGGDVDLEIYEPGIEAEPLPCASEADCVEGTRCIQAACVAPTHTLATRYQSEMFYRGRFTEPSGEGTEYLRLLRGEPPGEGVGYRIDVTHTPDAEGCEADGPERAGANDTPETATPLGAGDAALCDAWICPDERLSGDHYAVTVPAGEDRTVFLDFDAENEGRLFLYATGPQPDPADGLSGFARSEIAAGGQQCLNLRGGARETTQVVQVAGDRLFASRIDYALRIVNTDLDARPAGECETLGAPALSACPPRADWQDFPGIGRLQPDACYATLDAP